MKIVVEQQAGIAQVIKVADRGPAGSAQIAMDLASSLTGKGAELVAYKAPYTGAVPRTQASKNNDFVSVADFGAVGDGVTDDTAAIQACILASLGISSVGDTPTNCLFEVALSGVHKITTLYLPHLTRIRGGIVPTSNVFNMRGFVSTSNAPMLVLGSSLGVSNPWLDIRIRDLTITGSLPYNNPTNAASTQQSQHGIQGSFTGASSLLYSFAMSNVNIVNVGGSGIDIQCPTLGANLLNINFDACEITNTGLYGLHTKVDVINQVNIRNCGFRFCYLGGIYHEIVSGNTSPLEAYKLDSVRIESNGQNIGAGTNMTTGSFGFKSTMYSSLIQMDNCYVEGNGCAAGDTTGAGIDVTYAYSLQISNSLLITSNNLIIMRNGGFANIYNNFISSYTNVNAWFLFTGANVSTAPSTFNLGRNLYASNPTTAAFTSTCSGTTMTVVSLTSGSIVVGQAIKGAGYAPNTYVVSGSGSTWTLSTSNTIANAQNTTASNLIVSKSSSTTIAAGFIDGQSYSEVPERAKSRLLTDGTKYQDTQAVGYDGVRYIGTIGSGVTVPLCSLNALGLLVVLCTTTNEMALFMICATSKMVSDSGTLFTNTIGTASTINVGYAPSNGVFSIQNNTAGSLNFVVRFISLGLSIGTLLNQTYEAQFQ